MKTNKFISPFIGCVVQNFPFIEESIDGLTQYDLLCKIVEKLNAVITQTNTQTENIEKLEEAFTTLKNYVDNYFNNLDIQTEINNKLDEMATSGELEAIIASYLNTQAVRGFSTLNDLKNATGLISGAICQTLGKNTYKDGLGSLYRIRNITNEDTIDNDKLIAIVNDVSLVAEKITNNIRNTHTTSDTETYSCNYLNNIINNNDTLYESTDGTTGNVSLCKSITNYDYLDIVYGDNTRKMIQRIATNSTIFNLSRQIIDADKNLFFRNTQYTLSSNSISVQYFNAYTIYAANNNIVFETTSASGNTIYKVIGYKK